MNRMPAWGVFGINGRNINYYYNSDGTNTGIPLNGHIWTGEALWLYPIHASFNSRWNVQAKVDRTSKAAKIDDTETVLSRVYQRELYTSAELATTYASNFGFIGHTWNFTGGLAARKGFGDNGVNFTSLPIHGDQSYLLFRPAATLKFFWNNSIATGVEASGQYSKDSVPEQQQLVLGGMGNLTSSLPGVIVGDSGYLARAFTEVMVPISDGLELRPKIFAERGSARFSKSASSPLSGKNFQTRNDAGVELGIKFTQLIDASVSYAKSFSDKNISDVVKDSSDARLFFRVSVKL